MKTDIDTTRRKLGELASLAAGTEKNEREILARAEKRLVEVSGDIPSLRLAALRDPKPYSDAIRERGQLQQVIAAAHAALQG
jgi:hypothetical protein